MAVQQPALDKKASHSHRNVLIVGGGPAGLAAALMLAKRGWTEITVLEKRPAADYYEPDKSFNYLIDGRGQKLTDLLQLTPQLAAVSVSTQEFYVTRIQPDGKHKTLKLPLIDPHRKTAYWLPRKTFLSLLDREIEQNWSDQISVNFGSECIRIEKTQQKLQVLARTSNDTLCQFEPKLLVGCDGLNSLVRQTLAQWDDPTSDRFQMQLYPSPSAELRYKVLTLPPNFLLDRSGQERAICTMAYTIQSAFRDRKRNLFLGLFPVKDPHEPRGANIVRQPDHAIWQLKSAEQVYHFLEEAFPQLPVRQILSPEEAHRFAHSEGGHFPTPQYCRGLYLSLGQEQSVVLLGDAVHCFPPDIGQGVNSALEDIFVLDRVLSQSDGDIERALQLFESKRAADVKALVRLAQVAFPWQYNQNPLRRRLWSVNFFLRLGLSKVLPRLVNPPAFLLIQNHQLHYQEILSRVERTTLILTIAGLIATSSLLFLGAKLIVAKMSVNHFL